ncbi:MAG: hypothetical protein CVU06_16735 [Bacteroidetes bacterium HGW-Bacteroidetes-22]|nr:MAG: hypothetical protein CVU06_16735 [Bacteroidetes bacterium HGW-Bacteroidetes-22]
MSMKKNITLCLLALIIFVAGSPSFAQQKNQTFLSLNVGAGFPTGNFKQNSKTGFGGLADARYFVAKRLALGGTIGYFSFKGIPQTGDPTDLDFRYNFIPIMGNVSYYLGDGRFIAGFGTGIGFCRFDTKILNYESISTAGFKSCVMPHVHGLILINQKFSISLMTSYIAVFGAQVDVGFFTAMGGVTFKL